MTDAMTDAMRTNRDLYLFVSKLAFIAEPGDDPARSLERFLRRLRDHAAAFRARPSLTPSEFAALLAAAMAGTPAPSPSASIDATDPDFARWDDFVRAQIDDLRALADNGRLADELRYFGIDAPRGARWYNFEPSSYLEAAMAGTFGGWEDGDDTGRAYVPGDVAVLDADGAVTSVDPRTLDEPPHALTAIAWDDAIAFAEAGQSYE